MKWHFLGVLYQVQSKAKQAQHTAHKTKSHEESIATTLTAHTACRI